MPKELKLTKKQKKGLAFRERKRKVGAEEPADIPEPDIQDELNDEPASVRGEVLDNPVSERKSASKKRKLADLEVHDNSADGATPPSSQSPQKAKKKRPEKIENRHDSGDSEATTGPSGVRTKKFILFVGNLPYAISKEQIEQHFSDCRPPPSIRLLTPKPRSGERRTATQAAKSRGCAFLEFSSHDAVQLAIRKHHTELAGRRINVELTVGGGGNSDQRKERLRLRNRTLDEQRKKSNDRLGAKSRGSAAVSESQSENFTRHSTTSGSTEQPQNAKTWSFSTTRNEGKNSTKKRGSSKGKKKAGRDSWTVSGANAVAIG